MLKKVSYHAEREQRESGMVFYSGLIKPASKEGAGDEVVNESTFTLEPGDNYLSDEQIKVMMLFTGMPDKVKNKIIELPAADKPAEENPKVQTPEELAKLAEQQKTQQPSATVATESTKISEGSTAVQPIATTAKIIPTA